MQPQRNAYHRFTVDRHLWRPRPTPPALVDRVRRPDLLVLGRAAARHRQGPPGRPHRGRHRPGRHDGPTARASPPADVDVLAGDGAPPPAAARRRHPARPRRPRHDRARWPPPWRPAHPRAARRADRGRLPRHRPVGLGHVEGRAGRRARRPRRPRLGGGPAEDDRARTSRPPSTAPCCDRPAGAPRRRRRPHRRRARPARPVQPGGRRALAHGLGVLDAAVDRRDGMALEVFRVESQLRTQIAWDRVVADLRQVLEGRLAIQARLAERARVYASAPPAARRTSTAVVVDNDASAAPPSSRCTRPTRSACCTASPGPWPSSTSTSGRPRSRRSGTRSSTRSTSRSAEGEKVTDPAQLAEIERAILHELSGLTSRRRAAARRRPPHADLRAVERGARGHRPHRPRLHREPLRAGALRGGARTSPPTSAPRPPPTTSSTSRTTSTSG